MLLFPMIVKILQGIGETSFKDIRKDLHAAFEVEKAKIQKQLKKLRTR